VDASFWALDVDAALRRALEDPGAWPQTAGLRNTTDSCAEYHYAETLTWDAFDENCGVRYDEYAWKDPLHPTHVLHNLTAALVVGECFGGGEGGLCERP